MKPRRLATFALTVGLITGVMACSAAPPPPPSPTVPLTPEAVQKIDHLQKCIAHFKEARSGWTQEPNVERSYTKKIEYARRLISELQSGWGVPDDQIDEACKSPGTAPY
jgi:hypothetical protein